MQTAEQYRTEKPYAFKYLHVEVIVRLLVHLEVFNPLVERPPDAEVVVVEEEDDKNEIQAGVIRYFEESRGRNHSRRRTSRSSSCWSRRCSTSEGNTMNGRKDKGTRKSSETLIKELGHENRIIDVMKVRHLMKPLI